MRKFLVGVTAAAVAATLVCDAQAQLFGLGGRGDREATSVLEQVRAGAFNERCSAPIEETVEPGLEAYDIVDLLVGAPDGARYNGAYAGMPRSDAALDAILDQLVAVQPAPAGVTPTVHIQDTMDVDARQTSAGNIVITSGLVNALLERPNISQRTHGGGLRLHHGARICARSALPL